MSSFVKLLDKCRASDLGMAMWPSANFYHQFGRNFPSLVLNQACSYSVYCGSHSAKGHGNKTAIRAFGAGPLVSATFLAFLSAFWFPQEIVASPFWCSQQCVTATHLGAHTASSSLRISCPYLILFPPKLMSPLSLYKASWT
jgi:hypothetical protein